MLAGCFLIPMVSVCYVLISETVSEAALLKGQMCRVKQMKVIDNCEGEWAAKTETLLFMAWECVRGNTVPQGPVRPL